MSNYRKCISFVLAILVLLGSLASVSVFAASVTVDGVTYSTDRSKGTAAVVSYISQSSADEIKILSSVGGCTVTNVGSSAFRYKLDLAAVTIPNTVTSIEGFAFDGCRNLASVKMSENIRTLGVAAFRRCNALTSIELGSKLTLIGSAAFKETGLTEVTIPDICTEIGSLAFCDCQNLATVTMPKELCVLGSGAFQRCTALEEITLPEGVTQIEESTFENCRKLQKIDILGDVTSVGSSAFLHCSSLGEINLPDTVSSLGIYVFWNCDSLTEFDIPTALTSVDYQVFLNCDKLTKVTFSSGMSSIGQRAFMSCESLTDVIIPPNITQIDPLAFIGCKNLVIYGKMGSVAQQYADNNKDFGFIGYEVNPDSTATITLFDCPGITEYTLPEEIDGHPVTAIAPGAFQNNTEIRSLTMPGSIKEIGESAFSGCTLLSSFVLPTDEIHIGSYAFYDCPAIENVCLPDGVASLDECAFGYLSEGETSVVNPDFYIYGWFGGAVEQYCIDNDIEFRPGILKEIETGKPVMMYNYEEKRYEPGDKYRMVNVLGDIDLNLSINVKDATAIQRHCAWIRELDEVGMLLGDTDFDKNISVKDATRIQKYAALLIISFYD